MNINGLASKRCEFEVFLTENVCDVLCLSETHLTEENSALANFQGYSGFHFTRTKKTWGGSSILIKNETFSSVVEKTEFNDLRKEEVFELVAIEMRNKHETILCANIYRTPPKNTTALDDFLDRFESFLSRLVPYDRILICGDFNIDLLKHDKAQACFTDIVQGGGMILLNDAPTRKDAVLDNVIVKDSDADQMTCTTILSDLTDHQSVLRVTFLVDPEVNSTADSFELRHCNMQLLVDRMSHVDLSDIFCVYDVDHRLELLMNKVQDQIEACSSTRTVKRKAEQLSRNWVTDEIRELSTEKRRLFSKWRANPENDTYRVEYKTFANQVKNTTRKAKQKQERQEFLDCNGNSKQIWQLINKKRGKNPKTAQVSQIQTEEKLVSNTPELVELFSTHFDQISKELAAKRGSPCRCLP